MSVTRASVRDVFEKKGKANCTECSQKDIIEAKRSRGQDLIQAHLWIQYKMKKNYTASFISKVFIFEKLNGRAK